MWISVPTNVISSAKVTDSGSISSPTSTLKSPAGIQEYRLRWLARSPAGRPSSSTRMPIASSAETAEASTPSQCPQAFERLPASSSTAAPNIGAAISTQARLVTVISARTPSVLQQVDVVQRRRTACSEDGHDDRQPDHDLCGRHDHDEERQHLPVQVTVHPGEGHQGEVGGVQHQLHTHERHQGVASHQHGDRADAEQDAGEHQVVDQAHCCSPSPWSCWSGAVVSGSSTAELTSSGELTSGGGVPSPGSSSRSMSITGAPLAICSARTVCAVASACRCTWPRSRSTVVIEASSVLPGASIAGMSAELVRAYTPGPGAETTLVAPAPEANAASLASTISFCPSLRPSRRRWLSTRAPSAAVISSAAVSSNGKM